MKSIHSNKAIARLHVNGNSCDVMLRPADTLLHVLREELGLTGAKKACQNGDCGACSVLIDGKTHHACLSLAVETVDKPITTIEGLQNSPFQQAFVDNWAIQCGYCTPGFIVNCHALMMAHPDADDDTIEEWLASNICRCTGYEEIKQAVKMVLQQNKIEGIS